MIYGDKMKQNEGKGMKPIYVIGGLILLSVYLSRGNEPIANVTPENSKSINLYEGDYNGICVAVISLEKNIAQSDLYFQKFYLPSAPTVQLSNGKKTYECGFSDAFVSLKLSDNQGKTFSELSSRNKYKYKGEGIESHGYLIVENVKGNKDELKFHEITSANVAAGAKLISNAELDKVCQQAIAIEFGKKTNFVKIKEPLSVGGDTIKVGYVRPQDKTVWNYECKVNLNDNRIVWRALPGTNIDSTGRWRDGSNGFERDDSIINFNVLKGEIKVTVKYSDGSGSSGNIKR